MLGDLLQTVAHFRRLGRLRLALGWRRILRQPLISRYRAWVRQQRRPAKTLVYASTTHWVRLDLNRSGRPVFRAEGELTAARPAALVRGLDRILGQGPRPSRHCWILSEHLHLHALSLPASTTTAADSLALRHALQYELEVGHDLTVREIDFGWAQLAEADGLCHFVVVSGPKGLFNDAYLAAKRLRCRLEGMTHPGMLMTRLAEPMAAATSGADEDLDEPTDTVWARIESWPDITLGIRGQDLQVDSVECMAPGSGPVGGWLRSLRPAPGPNESVQAPHAPRIEPAPTHHDLNVEADHLAWLLAWGRTLEPRLRKRVPWLTPVITPQQEARISLTMAGAVLALAVIHGVWYLMHRSTLQQELSTLEMMDRQVNGLIAGNAANRNMIAEIRKVTDGLKTQNLPDIVERMRYRPLWLLTCLGRYAGDDIVIEKITINHNDLIISGVTLRVTEANRLYGELSASMTGMGYKAFLPEKTKMNLLDGGGPWEFSIRLTDTGLAGYTPRTAP